MNASYKLEESVESAMTGRIESLALRNFRNYREENVRLSSGFNVIVGRNAQGKTNFLEALYLLATTRLLRGQKDAEAILAGEAKATVTAELTGTGTELSIQLERGARKRALLNGLALPRAADIMGRMPCVCVSVADLEIVRGEPADRRLFLDLELSALSGGYLRHLALYKRALEQRNALLRDSRDRFFPPESFEIWEDQLAQHGAEIRRARIEFVRELETFAKQVHFEMGSGEDLSITYREKDESDSYEKLLEALAGTRSYDVVRGGTSVGPHRDDLDVLVEAKEARLFGSQGQQRTAVISIKMACLSLIEARIGQAPILLLDDILSDLDEKRRAMLVEIVLSRAGQAVLTCTEASAAGNEILSRAKLFEVSAGTVQEL